jgi:hypothetical protein
VQRFDVRSQPWNGLLRRRACPPRIILGSPDHNAGATARDPFTGTGSADLVVANMERTTATEGRHLRDEPYEE